MKKTISLLVFLFAAACFVSADTLTVKLDSTGNFISIQEAINHASYGDLILVYPGIYYENLDFKGKTFSLKSLYCQNPVDSIIEQTIIDGNQSGSCIKLVSGEQNCVIEGFTLQHGSGTLSSLPDSSTLESGGGLFARFCSLSLNHCFIHDNTATNGGGVLVNFSDATFAGNKVYNNHAYGYGGGVMVGADEVHPGNYYFDSTDLNSIYSNYSSSRYDLLVMDPTSINTIHLKTGTVSQQNKYYYSSMTSDRHLTDDITVLIDSAVLQLYDGDLYVSPEGSDTNSGIRPGEPLKTLAYALRKIKSNPLKQNTIWLAPGIYSQSLTGEKPGFGFKSNVPVVGAGMDKTIIDLEYQSYGGNTQLDDSLFIMRNLTVEHGSGFRHTLATTAGFLFENMHYVMLDSIRITNMLSPSWSCVFTALNDSLIVKNCRFGNSTGNYGFIIDAYHAIDTAFAKIQNTSFFNFQSSVHSTIVQSTAVKLQGDRNLPDGKGLMKAYFIDCLFNDNIENSHSNLPNSTGLIFVQHTKVTIVNSTFCNNTSPNSNSSAMFFADNSNATIYNTIFYYNRPYQLGIMSTSDPDDRDSLFIYNSCIENGMDGIKTYGDRFYIYYDSATNISDNPVFVGGEEYPYNINDNSPCIDRGTLDLPDYIELPSYDLAGNPRIVNGKVDIGAYEWNPMVGFRNNKGFLRNNKKKQLEITPNPFFNETKLKIKTNRHCFLKIYDLGGLLVKDFGKFDSESVNAVILWDGTSDNGEIVPAGIYIATLVCQGKTIESIKIVKK